MVLDSIYYVANELLTFYVPVFYTFKFLMNKETTRIPTILKFWCILSCYQLLSLLLRNILDDKIFPIIHVIVLVGLNWPNYDIAEKVYDSSLGPIFKQNRQSLQTMEDSVIGIFDKNTEKLKNRVKDSTNDRVKGFMGDVLMATINTTKQPERAPQREEKYRKKVRNSDSQSGSQNDE